MKQKNLTLLTLMLFMTMFISSNIFAQTVEWGRTNKTSTKNYYPEVIDEDDDYIYTWSTIGKYFYVESFSKNGMKKRYSKKIELDENLGKKVELEGVAGLDNNIMLFVSYFNKKKNTSNIVAYKIDKKNGKQDRKKTEILSVNVEKKRRRGSFYVSVSEDKSKILINHYAYYKKKKKEVNRLMLFDNEMNLLVEAEDDNEEIKSYIIDNDGSIYYINNTSIVSLDANKEFEKWEEKIDLLESGARISADITDITFNITSDNNLVVSAFYAVTEKRDGDLLAHSYLDGYFFMKIDNLSKEIVVSKVGVFSKDFKQQFQSEKELRKGKEANVGNNFRSIEIYDKPDGGIVVIAESYIHIVTENNNGVVGESWIYGDLVTYSLDKDGELGWAQRIPKQQIYSYNCGLYPIVFSSTGISLFVTPGWKTTEYFSYLAGMDKENLYILFNDHTKNNLSKSDNAKLKPLKNIKKSTITKYTINIATGEKKEDLYLKARDNTVIVKPKVSYQKSLNSNIIIFGQKGKSYKYGTLKF